MINAIGIALGGLSSAVQKVTSAANNIASIGDGSSTTPAGDTVELSEEAVNLMLAETEFKANIGVIKTAEEMSDELLRIFDDEA